MQDTPLKKTILVHSKKAYLTSSSKKPDVSVQCMFFKGAFSLSPDSASFFWYFCR